MTPEDYIVKRRFYEQIELVCPMAERNAIIDWLGENEFHITENGPFRTRKMFPKVDPSRFMLTAQRITARQP